MFKFNFRLALRNLLRNKVYSLINIMGLAIGIMSILFIMLWVRDELSFDGWFKNSRNIYRIYWQDEHPQTRTPHPMTYAMVNDFPEVENAVSLSPVWGEGLTQPDRLVKYGEKWFEESRIYAADTTFFQIFSFRMIKGNPTTALKDVGSLVITESMAKKYFGDEDPMGKIITINFGQDAGFRITGVMQDIPHNTHFHFDFLISYVTMKAYDHSSYYTWDDFGHYNYIVLRDGADPDRLEKRLFEWSLKYIHFDNFQVSETQLNALKRGDIGFRLQPITDIHLKSHLKWELEANGDISYIYIFSALGMLILLIACVNFTNISIARTTGRLIEIGIKKISGASQFHIKFQFLFEALCTIIISFAAAIILFELFEPALSITTGKSFNLTITDPGTLLIIVTIIILCSVLTGIYPSVVLSKLSPAGILKGNTGSRFRNSGVGYFLLVFQFAVSIFLIIIATVISRQTSLLQDKKLGFDSNQVLAIPLKDSQERQNYEFVKADILKDSHVESITAVSNIPGRNFNQNSIQLDGADRAYSASELRVDEDFFKTLRLKIIDGRGFSKDVPSDIDNAYILNETAAGLFKGDTVLNRSMTWYDDDITRKGKVIGIVEDFHFQSLRSGIEPMIIQLHQPDFSYFLIRIKSDDISGTINVLKSKFEILDPAHPFTYFFLDDDFAKLYSSEIRMRQVTGYFTVFALIISCIGLFGMSSFIIEKRTKEIGIRKVNGASVTNIIGMLTSEFIRWVVLAFVIAGPIAWLFSRQWLNNFSVKVNISLLIFLAAGFITLLLALVTVLHHAWKVAVKNPVETLRYE
jgi:putative ABC transport system permease protein